MPRQLQATRALEPAEPEARHTPNALLGRILAFTPDGTLMLEVPGSDEPVRGRLAVPLTAERLSVAVAEGRQAVLVFEAGDLSKPIVVGLIEEPAAASEAANRAADQKPFVVEADADGRRVRVSAQDEIVLEVGEASITLRRNGRVLIRGAYVETRAGGTNRIKGAQVRVN